MKQAQADNQIATTILKQLGGSKFIAMTGSKNFVASEDGLTMRLSSNKANATHLKITLDNNDTYTMVFFKCKGVEVKEVAKYNGVYCDMLQSLFTKVTALDTQL